MNEARESIRAAVQGRSDDWYLDGFLSEVDGLLTLKDDLIDPIQTFLQNNKQYGIYDTARVFLDEQAAEIDAADAAEVAALREALATPEFFRDNRMRRIKQLHDQLAARVQAAVATDRAALRTLIEQRLETLLGDDVYREAPTLRKRSPKPDRGRADRTRQAHHPRAARPGTQDLRGRLPSHHRGSARGACRQRIRTDPRVIHARTSREQVRHTRANTGEEGTDDGPHRRHRGGRRTDDAQHPAHVDAYIEQLRTSLHRGIERKDGAAVKNSAGAQAVATSARVTLIEQMRGQIDRVLGDPTIRAENPLGHSALQRGQGRRSADWVAETAAYTWFNRLTAARYMDAREFSGLYGVVSPAPGSASTLPEILLRAQAGEYPGGMSDDDRTKVGKLLTRERPSPDHDGGVRAALRAVFKEWNRPMPDVFPYRVDWITLLVPPDMLAPTSVRARAVEVMDAEVCEDVEVVGWLYQFYNADLKEEINKSKVPIDAAELPAVTQLFTPDWIVRYLVENSLGRLWLRSRPGSGLRDHMTFYVEPIDGQDDTGVTVSTPEEIRIVDPACGSGACSPYAFDLMYRIYEEEGYTPSSIPRLILANNLRGIEIDERAAQLASFALAMKARDKDRRFLTRSGEDAVQPDIVWLRPSPSKTGKPTYSSKGSPPADRAAVGDLLTAFADADTFGSLSSASTPTPCTLTRRRDRRIRGQRTQKATSPAKCRCNSCSARGLSSGKPGRWSTASITWWSPTRRTWEAATWGRAERLRQTRIPETKPDLYAMFVERNAEFAVPAGSVAMVTMHSWMFLTSYKVPGPDV